ncbi:MAG: hypothetical protein LBN41_02040 [Enterobacteriaceae bacterium]|jgi:hypothetical protein|nr:hypothetical protein [Enterobacteriaceae bacterium]
MTHYLFFDEMKSDFLDILNHRSILPVDPDNLSIDYKISLGNSLFEYLTLLQSKTELLTLAKINNDKMVMQSALLLIRTHAMSLCSSFDDIVEDAKLILRVYGYIESQNNYQIPTDYNIVDNKRSEVNGIERYEFLDKIKIDFLNVLNQKSVLSIDFYNLSINYKGSLTDLFIKYLTLLESQVGLLTRAKNNNDELAMLTAILEIKIYAMGLSNIFDSIVEDAELLIRIGDWADIPEHYKIPDYYNHQTKE